MREGAEQHVGRPAPGAFRRSNQSHWISSPGGWSISMVSRPLTPRRLRSAGGARPAHLADEARIAERIAESVDLVIEGRGPDVRVVDETRREVVRNGSSGSGAERARTPGTRSPLI